MDEDESKREGFDDDPVPEKARTQDPTTPTTMDDALGQMKNLESLFAFVDKITATSDALEQIEKLKNQLNILLDFVEVPEIARDAPPAVKSLLLARDSNLDALEASIDRRISIACDSVTTINDFSRAMCEFIPDIDALSRIDNPRALELAYTLVNSLRTSSYGYLDEIDEEGGCDGSRPSDEPADELLARITREMMAAGHEWDAQKDLEEIQEEAAEVGAYGIEPWFPETQKALGECVKAWARGNDR